MRPGSIDICHRMQLFLVHEMAHAWAAHTMDDATRAAIMGEWGVAE
ncbi:MAG: hypothetical protein ACI8Y4_004538 [Candidatus Poriferisodalaceae bacterium]|jgi:hypothetical protein